MRIVSLVASATEIVAFLGLGDQLVGVSADSDWPTDVVSGLPVLNTIAFDPNSMTSREIDAAASHGHAGASLYHVDADVLRQLRPDAILTQEVCDVCSVSRRDLEGATHLLGYAPDVVSLNAVGLQDVFADIEAVAKAAGASSSQQVADLKSRLAHLQTRTNRLPRPRVACLEWLDPLYCAGHWVPELVELAGGSDTLGQPLGPSREIAWQDVIDYAPDVMVLMPCSLSLERVAAEFDLLTRLQGWRTLPAVERGQVFAGHTDLFSRSGPRLVDGAEALARLLHPEVFVEPIAAGLALRVSADGLRLEPYR